MAHFYGHTHTDSFRIFRDKKEQPVGIGFIAPSVTPLLYIRHGVNPSFRIYEYDHVGRMIINYEQRYLDWEKVTGENLYGENVNDEDYESDKNIDTDDDDKTNGDTKNSRGLKGEVTSKLVQSDRRRMNSKMRTFDSRRKRSAEPPKAEADADPDQDENDPTTTTTEDSAETDPAHVEGYDADAAEEVTETNDIKEQQQRDDAAQDEPDSNSGDENNDDNNDIVEDAEDAEDANAEVPCNENCLNGSGENDTVVAFLLENWATSYYPASNFNLPSMGCKDMFKLYGRLNDSQTTMTSQYFKYFYLNSFVKRYKDEALSCNETCYRKIMCALVEITAERFDNCLVNAGIKNEPPSSSVTTTTTTITQSSKSSKSSKSTTASSQKVSSSSSKSATSPSTPTPKPKNSGGGGNSEEWDNPVTKYIDKNRTAEDNGGKTSHVTRGIMVGLAVVGLVAIGVAGLLWYRKQRLRPACSQEFLLDSFRYDGYSQIDQP